MFQRCQKTGLFVITRNIKAKHVQCPGSAPKVFPTHPDGVATVLLSNTCPTLAVNRPAATQSSADPIISLILSNEEIFSLRVKYGEPYSINFCRERNSSVKLRNVVRCVVRRTGKCTGVKCCDSSHARASSGHNSITWPDPFRVPRDEISLRDWVDQPSDLHNQHELARQVFLFAQSTFPDTCKHHGLRLNIEKHREQHGRKQHRRPNWVFRQGNCFARTLALQPSRGTAGLCQILWGVPISVVWDFVTLTNET